MALLHGCSSAAYAVCCAQLHFTWSGHSLASTPFAVIKFQIIPDSRLSATIAFPESNSWPLIEKVVPNYCFDFQDEGQH